MARVFMYVDSELAVTASPLDSNPASSTGATGYIGGDVLAQLQTQYPEMVARVLVRTEDNAKRIQDRYPSVQPIQGSLSDTTLLQNESANADIIIRELACSPPIKPIGTIAD